MVFAIKADPTNPAAFYKRVRAVCTKLGLEAEKVGLTFENEKAQILLPPDWAPPDDLTQLPGLQIRSNCLEDVQLQGMVVVGSPVGSDKFCRNFVRNAIDVDAPPSSYKVALKLYLTCPKLPESSLSPKCGQKTL